MFKGGITDVPGILVGHAQSEGGRTGCTVILCPEGAVAGVDVRGSAPGTRETDLLRPMNLVEKIHAVVLSGGSAFGLAAADGVMQYLEEQGIGFDVGVARVPIVSAAVLFDLAVGDPGIRPDRAMGYEACKNASSGRVLQGSFGAGTGATVGKVLGMEASMKSGIGTASLRLPGGILVGAIVAVNAFGDVVEPGTGRILAGARNLEKGGFLNTKEYLLAGNTAMGFAGTNTTIGVVATNARLSKEQANKLASMAHDGLAQTIQPVHTMMDGDTLFALSAGQLTGDFTAIGAAAVEVTARAVVNAVLSASRE